MHITSSLLDLQALISFVVSCYCKHELQILKIWSKPVTCIIADQVRMVFLNAVVKYSHHYTSSRVALSPGYFGIQVLVRRVGLQETQGFCLTVNLW